jgi:hypothetical protein
MNEALAAQKPLALALARHGQKRFRQDAGSTLP